MVSRTSVILALLALTSACAQRASAPLPPPPPRPPARIVEIPPRRSTGALTQAERDSLVREVAARREAWRARRISDYSIEVAVGCFCPWPSHPAVLEVRRDSAVALRDTTGKSMGKPREPWSRYTVEGLFDAVAESARSSDVVEVAYDPAFGYPAMMRGTGRIGLPDNWFWVRASRLMPLR